MEISNDNFEYINRLVKTLSLQCWNNRQETDKIDHLVKTLAKQNQISYEQFSQVCNEKTLTLYKEISKESEKERLIRDNYDLIYKIEQQEYVHSRILFLIDQINDLITSIKKFVADQKVTRSKIQLIFFKDKIYNQLESLHHNMVSLKNSKESSKYKVKILCEELKNICSQIEWKELANENKDSQNLINKIKQFEKLHNIKLISI